MKKLFILLTAVMMAAMGVKAEETKLSDSQIQAYNTLNEKVKSCEFPFQSNCAEYDLGTLNARKPINEKIEFYITNVSDVPLDILMYHCRIYAHWLKYKISFSKQDSILPNEEVKVTIDLDWREGELFGGKMFRKKVDLSFAIPGFRSPLVKQDVIYLKANVIQE